MRQRKTLSGPTIVKDEDCNACQDDRIPYVPVPDQPSVATPVIVVVLLWLLGIAYGVTGIAAVIVSLICMGKKKTVSFQDLLGVFFAFLFGPFYFIYYHFEKKSGYCA